MQRPAWGFFVILNHSLPIPQICKDFFKSSNGFSLAQGTICRQLRLPSRFSMPTEDTSSLVAIVFMRVLSLFPYPDAAAGNLSRPIPSRMARNNSRGTATSAIWRTIFREWRTTFAAILIGFSHNVVNVQ
ncbi:MAG: hypothetical protein ABSA45_04500 [Verrucomicrobiota bacterium]